MFRTAALFAAFSAALLAQSVNGTFVGLITDPSKAVIPGAAVEFTDVQRGLTTKTITGQDGTYTLPYMQTGQYSARILARGFKVFERSGIELALGSAVRVDAMLEPGSLTESIHVTTEAPLLQTDRAELARTIDQKAIVDLPRLGRNYQTALLLSPGAGIPANYWTPENSYSSQSLNGNQDTQVNGNIVAANEYKMD